MQIGAHRGRPFKLALLAKEVYFVKLMRQSTPLQAERPRRRRVRSKSQYPFGMTCCLSAGVPGLGPPFAAYRVVVRSGLLVPLAAAGSTGRFLVCVETGDRRLWAGHIDPASPAQGADHAYSAMIARVVCTAVAS